jgi:hypothetical protein
VLKELVEVLLDKLVLSNAVELSLYPITPTWDRHRDIPSRWSLQSGVGASVNFF